MIPLVVAVTALAILSGSFIQEADARDCIYHKTVNLFKAKFPSATDVCWDDRNSRTLESGPARLYLYEGNGKVMAALTCPLERKGQMSADNTMISDTGLETLLTRGCGKLADEYIDAGSLTHSEISVYFKHRKPGYTEEYLIDVNGPRYVITNSEGNQKLTLTRPGKVPEVRFDCNDGTYDRYAVTGLRDAIRHENCENTKIISSDPKDAESHQIDGRLAGTARYHAAVVEFHSANPGYIEEITHTGQGGHTYSTKTPDHERVLDIEYWQGEVVGTHYTCTDHDGNRGTHHTGIVEMIRTNDCGGWKHFDHPQNLLPKPVGHGYPAASPYDHALRAVWGSHHVAAFKAVSGPFTDGMEYRHGSPVYVIRDKAGSMVLELRTQGGTHGATLTCTTTGKVIRGDIFGAILDGPCPSGNGGDNRPTPSSFGGNQGPVDTKSGGGTKVLYTEPSGERPNKFSKLYASVLDAFRTANPGSTENSDETSYDFYEFTATSRDQSKRLLIKYYDTSDGILYESISYTCTDNQGIEWTTKIGIISMIEAPSCSGEVGTRPDGSVPEKIPLHIPDGVPVHQAAMITDPIRAFTATIGDYTVEDRVLDYDHHLLVYKDVGSDAMLETEVILNEIIGWTYTCADGQSTTQSDGPAMAAMILDGRCDSPESTFFSEFIKIIGSLFATEPVRSEKITT